MSGVAFEFPNADSFINDLKKMLPSVRDDVEKAVNRGAILIQDKAKEIIYNVTWVTKGKHGLKRFGGGNTVKQYFEAGETIVGHVDTGTLGRSIKHKVGWTSATEITALIGTDVPYAVYVEALPDGGFLYKAAMENSQEAFEYIQAELKKRFGSK